MSRSFNTGPTNALPVAPVSVSSRWDTMVSGNLGTAPGSEDTTDPVEEAGWSTKSTSFFTEGRSGTFLRLRLKYPVGLTGPFTNPVVQVFGRTGADQAWQRLFNKNGDKSIVFTPSDGDLRPTAVAPAVGGYAYTDSTDDHTVDLDGCTEIRVFQVIAFTATSGSIAGSAIEGKMI